MVPDIFSTKMGTVVLELALEKQMANKTKDLLQETRQP
jgi:hypothetical protein